MADPCLLIGDIGGTNARFALVNPDSPTFSSEVTFKCRDFPSADTAINAYLKKVEASQPSAICIAAAGPVIDGTVRFTNNSWSLDTDELEKAFDGASVRLLNDFEAITYSIPNLQAKDCLRVGLPSPVDLSVTNYTIGIVGPGTGLGIAGLQKKGGQLCTIVGEGGHVGFAPETQLQVDLLTELRKEFDRVSDERLASGPGIVNIYKALSKIRRKKVMHLDAAEIFALAMERTNSTAVEAVQVFFEVLGQVAGDIALLLGTSDGIYIGGGIVSRKPELIAESPFRMGFERKGRYRSLMEDIPTQVILHPQPGLLGASYCALQTQKRV